MITKSGGTYALILKASSLFSVVAGKLGKIEGGPGYYIYTGSAFGPGGLQARLNHHLGKSERPHWHIDHIRKKVPIIEIWYTTDQVSREHQWFEILINYRRSAIPFPGFGSSDCKCISHMVFFSKKPGYYTFRKKCKKMTDNHGPLFIKRFI